jgi:membrane-bound serine protease (ClpP class)
VTSLAEREKCSSILLLINTPGGGLESTRLVVESILSSPRPYLCLVAPSGGHAGSAGAIILQACHVNGALVGTNLGAATPVSLGGNIPTDLRHKIMNDTTSWLDSLTALRGRNSQFGKDIIVDAKAVSAEEALKLKAIDFVGATPQDFLKFAEGRHVKLEGNREGVVKTGEVWALRLDLRYSILSFITDPEFAYMLLLGSFALIYFEITHPGLFLPGVAGAVGLVVALMALHRLDVEWGGLIFIFLGVGLMIAEMFLPTFGVVGLVGVGALFVGSLFLFDPVKTGYQLPYLLIVPVVIVFTAIIFLVAALVWRTRRVKKKGGIEDMLGLEARIRRVDAGGQSGQLEVHGETWTFESATALNVDERVKITGHRGLVLKVHKHGS